AGADHPGRQGPQHRPVGALPAWDPTQLLSKERQYLETLTLPRRADVTSLDAAIEIACRDLYIRALKQFPPDVTAALDRAAAQETSPIAGSIMQTICDNIRVAHERSLLHCQDTGIPVFFVKIGTEFPLAGLDVTDAIRRGTERATREHPLRSSSTH